MEKKLTCGTYLAENANLSGSRFHDVNLSGADFDDVNMSGVRFHNINMSGISVSAVQMGGAHFKHIGLPPCSPGKQKPIVFDEADLNGSKISKCDLSNVQIENCNMEGMTIDGIAVSDLLSVYKQKEN